MKLTGKIPRLDSLYATARSEAIARGKPVLMSWSEAVPAIDPLTWLESVVRGSDSDPSLVSLLGQGTAYWNHPAEGLAYSGIGAAVTLAPEGAQRFDSADEQWREIVDGAVTETFVDAPPNGDFHRCAGPILIGGFAFDETSAKTAEWRDFGSTRLVVPSILLTTTGTESRVTFALIVDPHDDLARIQAGSQRLMVAFAVADRGLRPGKRPPAVLSYDSVMPAPEWRDLVSDAVDEINQSALEKVVLARAVRATADGQFDVFQLLRHLSGQHRDAFVFGFWRGSSVFVGASPERLVRLDGRLVGVSSLAGTARRYNDPVRDQARAEELLASAKDRGEHSLVRDALVAALSELCDNISAPPDPEVLTLPQVHHLHTAISGELRPGHTLLDLVERLHPTPAVGGSPRERALAFIRDREGLDRGWYAGPIGWIGSRGGEFAVALRSGLVSGSIALLFAGCGIVAASDPDLELAESMLKLRLMQSALEAGIVSNSPSADRYLVAPA